VRRFLKSGNRMTTKSHTDNMNSNYRLSREFYTRDVLEVAPDLIGKYLVARFKDGSIRRYQVNDVEAYRGLEDKACHASKGKTTRTSIMFGNGGHLYVYLIYGMYWMLNIVTGTEGNPQAVLLRGIADITGPGKITKILEINRSYYGEDLITSERIWLENSGIAPAYKTGPRIGIDYAGEYWKSVPWRYYI
jgi:DNA-3-methyladenine glycosylase